VAEAVPAAMVKTVARAEIMRIGLSCAGDGAACIGDPAGR
jgi:hypothetical protein